MYLWRFWLYQKWFDGILFSYSLHVISKEVFLNHNTALCTELMVDEKQAYVDSTH